MTRRLAAAALAIGVALVSAGVREARAGVTGTGVNDEYGTGPAAFEDQVLSIPANIGVLANDLPNDPDAPPYKCVDTPNVDTSSLDGKLEIQRDGSFTFTPEKDFNGSTSFTYKMGTSHVGVGSDACPEGGPSNNATVTITVSPVNDPPTVVLDSVCSGGVTVAEDSGAFANPGHCVEMSDFGPPDENSQSFDAWLVSSTNSGLFASRPSITAVDGTFGRLRFTPASNASGTSTVTVRGRDSGGTGNGGDDTSDPVQFDIEIRPVNDAPVAVADSFFALANRTLNVGSPGVLGNDSDIDDSSISAVKVSNPAHGVVTLAADGSFSYTPAEGYTGPDAFSYRASDGSAMSPPRVVTISVSTVPPLNTPTPFPSALPSGSHTPLPTLAEPSASTGAPASLDPGISPAGSLEPSPSASLEPGATPVPGPSSGEGGLPLAALLIIVLLGLLVAFGAAVYVPKWLKARQAGVPMDDG